MAVGIKQPATTRSIHQRAYELWQLRGCPNGSSQQDWLAAERELNQSLPTAPIKKARARSLSVRRVQRSSTRLLAALVPQALGAVG